MKRKISPERRKQLLKLLEKARAARKVKGKKSRKKTVGKVRKPHARKKRAANPIRHKPLYALKIQRISNGKEVGPRMHFDGVKFTTNGKAVLFENEAQLREATKKLMGRHAHLRDYKFIGVPIRGTVSGKS